MPPKSKKKTATTATTAAAAKAKTGAPRRAQQPTYKPVCVRTDEQGRPRRRTTATTAAIRPRRRANDDGQGEDITITNDCNCVCSSTESEPAVASVRRRPQSSSTTAPASAPAPAPTKSERQQLARLLAAYTPETNFVGPQHYMDVALMTPAFIVNAVKLMNDPKFRAGFPDLELRYDAVTRSLFDNIYDKNDFPEARSAVFAILNMQMQQ